MCVSAKSLVLEMQQITLHKIQEHMLEEGRRGEGGKGWGLRGKKEGEEKEGLSFISTPKWETQKQLAPCRQRKAGLAGSPSGACSFCDFLRDTVLAFQGAGTGHRNFL